METQFLVGGHFETGAGPAECIVDPKTGEVVVEVPEASDAQLDAAVCAATRSRCARRIRGWE